MSNGDQQAAGGETAKEQTAEGGIPIPGVTGEEGEGEEEGTSFADDPKLQKAYEELRSQQQEAGADEGRRERKRKKP